tara:strand:- start:23 stop:448 length:426 start_codon:yes stop_codon:yes gene_type:complete
MKKDPKIIKESIINYLNNSKLHTVNSFEDFILNDNKFSKDLDITKLSENPEYVNELADSLTTIIFTNGFNENLLEPKIETFIEENMNDLLYHSRGLNYDILLSNDKLVNNISKSIQHIIDKSPEVNNTQENKKSKQKSLTF